MEWDKAACAHRQQRANDAGGVVYIQGKSTLVSSVGEALRQVRGIGKAKTCSNPVNPIEQPPSGFRSEGTCTTVSSSPIGGFDNSLRCGTRRAGGDQGHGKRKSRKNRYAKCEIEEKNHSEGSDLYIHNLSDDKRSKDDQRASSIEKLSANGVLKEDVRVARIGKIDESEHDEGQ